MDFSIGGDGCIAVIAIPFGLLFAVGTLLAALLNRPFRLICGLAAIAAVMNLGLLWFFWIADTWPWEKAIPLVGITVTSCGVLASAILDNDA